MQRGFPKQPTPRRVEELIALGDGHCEQFSDAEMNVLFQHLREKSLGTPDNGEEDWQLFQWQLQRCDIPIDCFKNSCPKAYVPPLRSLLLSLWDRQTEVSGYDKRSWRVFRHQLNVRGIDV